MKSKHVYIVLLLVFITFTTLIVHFRKPEAKLELQMRQGELASSSEWLNTQSAIQGLINDVNAHPENLKAKLQLALAYIQESRISGNHAYYDQTALQLLEAVIKKDPENVDALCSKATVLLSQHHFSEALPIAQKALEINPYNSSVYGIMTDAYVELGQYDDAVKMADRMVAVRPDLRSYSRISYLREIFGDYPGAIEAMKLAVSAGYPGLEQTSWTRTGLGHLYELNGDLPSAEMHYKITLFERPEYAFALAGLGRVEKAKGNYNASIHYFQKAKTIVNDFSFDDELTELFRINNQPGKATASAHAAIDALSSINKNDGNGHGHYADRELAHAYLNGYQYRSALAHALIEYNRRPGNIDVNQTLAWVYYKLGKYEDANKYINVAMRTGSKNPVLIYQAGLIKLKAGQQENGMALLNEALSYNPFLSTLLKWEGKEYLALM